MLWSRAAGLVLVGSWGVACGGATPAPKGESEAASATSPAAAASDTDSKKDSDSKKDEAAAAPGAGATESSPPADGATPAPAKKASSGDLTAPAADDPWMAPHQMPPGDVLKTMRAAMSRVNACYRTAKKHDPSVSGDVKIKFVVTHDGAVRVWRDEDSSMSDPDCTKCVGEVIHGLKFPTQKSPGDAWGIYTINFGG